MPINKNCAHKEEFFPKRLKAFFNLQIEILIRFICKIFKKLVNKILRNARFVVY